ncbi:MAG: hypothetical protein ACOCZV_00920 [Nanoarchaeota archaeon]
MAGTAERVAEELEHISDYEKKLVSTEKALKTRYDNALKKRQQELKDNLALERKKLDDRFSKAIEKHCHDIEQASKRKLKREEASHKRLRERIERQMSSLADKILEGFRKG